MGNIREKMKRRGKNREIRRKCRKWVKKWVDACRKFGGNEGERKQVEIGGEMEKKWGELRGN